MNPVDQDIMVVSAFDKLIQDPADNDSAVAAKSSRRFGA
jgi:hypothetical protein